MSGAGHYKKTHEDTMKPLTWITLRGAFLGMSIFYMTLFSSPDKSYFTALIYTTIPVLIDSIKTRPCPGWYSPSKLPDKILGIPIRFYGFRRLLWGIVNATLILLFGLALLGVNGLISVTQTPEVFLMKFGSSVPWARGKTFDTDLICYLLLGILFVNSMLMASENKGFESSLESVVNKRVAA